MGDVAKGLLSIVGLGGQAKASTAKAKPVTAAEPIKDVTDDQDKAGKIARATLYETSGGASGQELSSGQVKKRETLLGN